LIAQKGMKQKKLMLLGGIRYLLPVIKAAHEQGYYVITADYLPDNIAHRFSDEYVNVSIIDKEAVLRVAQEKRIDGIMSFGVDPGVISAAYVQEKLGLPSFGPYESVCILQNKDRFRAFLSEHGFNVPKAKGYSNLDDALADRDAFEYPVIVKPTDSAGSKGVTRVDDKTQLKEAVEHAFDKSLSGHVIVEDFIEKQGCSSDTDSFSVDGQLKFVSFNAQRFDANAANPYTPAAYSWPSTFTKEEETYLTSEIQRVISLLGMKTCVYNIETRIGTNGKPYIMELTPRGGGNRLCEMLNYATGVDMITAITRYVVGDSVPDIEQKPYEGHWAEVILHAEKEGSFDHLEIANGFPAEIVEEDLWVSKGEYVNSFEGANNAIGTLVLKFDDGEVMEKHICNIPSWLKVKVN
jgi:carbamoylphosphate synthase large subunit